MLVGFKRSFSLFLADLFVLVASFIVAYYYRFGTLEFETPYFLKIFVIVLVVNALFDLYSLSGLPRGVPLLVTKLMATGMALLGTILLAYFFFDRRDIFGRGFLLLFFGLYALMGVILYRFWHLLSPWMGGHQSLRFVIPEGMDFSGISEDVLERGYYEAIDTQQLRLDPNSLEDFRGRIKEWSDPNLTVVISDECFKPEFFDLLLKKKVEGMRIYQLSSFCEEVLKRLPVDILKPSRLIYSGRFRLSHDAFSLRLKRLGDLILCGLVFLLTWPVMLVAALMVKLTSRGPAFYSQTRVGQYGKHFTIYKLRTMVNDAEKEGAQWAQKGDARITPLGKLLRLTRIDELPQLWNILKGDMSIIGPRPERPEFVEMLEKEIPFYNLRHYVKPGISGWAQVMYPYGASVEDAKAKHSYDLFYIKNYSFPLDLLIVFRTVQIVLKMAGR